MTAADGISENFERRLVNRFGSGREEKTPTFLGRIALESFPLDTDQAFV
jgi:hypothetical protein